MSKIQGEQALFDNSKQGRTKRAVKVVNEKVIMKLIEIEKSIKK